MMMGQGPLVPHVRPAEGLSLAGHAVERLEAKVDGLEVKLDEVIRALRAAGVGWWTPAARRSEAPLE